MQLDYEKILKENGFDAVPEAEDTTLAFRHELHNTLFEEDSPFNDEQSSVEVFPDLLEHMMYCSLTLKPGKSVEEGVSYLINIWYSRLSYLNPKYESIQRTTSKLGTEVRIFTVARAVCSFLFTITDEAAGKAIQDFMDGYSPVDTPEDVLKNIRSLK